MNAIPYTTKKGAKRFRPECSSEEIQDGSLGFCLACGEEAYGVEPDARKYTCECCDAPAVYGLEELLMMGLCSLADEA